VVHTPTCVPLSKYPDRISLRPQIVIQRPGGRLRPCPSVPRPSRKTGPPDGWVDSGVAENTPGNKLSCSILNLFPSGTDISVLGNCLSSSTATPPSEHTPLRRRCCSEPFRHSTEADPPARLLASSRKPRFPQAGLLLFQRSRLRNGAPVIVSERAGGFWKFRASRTAYFQLDTMQCSRRRMMLLTATCS